MDAKSKLEEFNPTDPQHAMADSFTRHIAKMVAEAQKTTIYREMPAGQRITCLINGTLTGLIAMCFDRVIDDARDEMIDYIKSCCDVARKNAEMIIDQYKRETGAK